MTLKIILIYVICDEFLSYMNHHDHHHSQMSDTEVLSAAIVAMVSFGGNYAGARRWLEVPHYLPNMLSNSRLSRRLKRLKPYLPSLFQILGEEFKARNDDQNYAIDTFPVLVCDNYRIDRCRIYTDEAYRGYIAGKKRYFYGLKVHLLITERGEPVEFFFTPGSASDVAHLMISILIYHRAQRSMLTRLTITISLKIVWLRVTRSPCHPFAQRIPHGLSSSGSAFYSIIIAKLLKLQPVWSNGYRPNPFTRPTLLGLSSKLSCLCLL
jgi:hypothetical protein